MFTKEQWEEETERCALAMMEIACDQKPSVALPALVACVQTTITLCANDHEHAMKMLKLVRDKLDKYEQESSALIDFYRNEQEGLHQ